jgi:selenocysteine lyase/cysteine desulfurase
MHACALCVRPVHVTQHLVSRACDAACGAQCIPDDSSGVLDLALLEQELVRYVATPLKLGFFSAGSSVTGIAPNVHAIARTLHCHGALAAFDYAAAGASVPVQCAEGITNPLETLDAVMLSPHKFAGGPGGTGALVVRRDLICNDRPLASGELCTCIPHRTRVWLASPHTTPCATRPLPCTRNSAYEASVQCAGVAALLGQDRTKCRAEIICEQL